jgi:hypothetical protein
MSTELDEYTDVTKETEDGVYTHIIDRGNDTRPAAAIVLEARVLGIALTALCGYVFVPQRDPVKYPPCDKCVEMWEFAKDFRS